MADFLSFLAPRVRTWRAPALLVALLVTGGCAIHGDERVQTTAPSSPPAAVEPSPSDPFAAIDAVFAGFAAEPVDEVPVHGYRSIWPRLTSRFSISECPDGSEALRWAHWYADNPEYMERVFNRARPWLYFIADEVERRDLPGELALLPVVESAFDPFAYSRGAAAGPWQFLSGTAEDFGVRIDDWYDGRRDFVTATTAAFDYLQYLQQLFDGDWSLALAAYNAGQGRVARAIRRNAVRGRPTDWQSLSLPRETRGYVPKLKGLGCLFADPARFAFVPPFIEDRAQIEVIEVTRPVDLAALALETGLEPEQLVTLNAGLNRHLLYPDRPGHLVVPIDEAERVRRALDTLETPAPRVAMRELRVRRGDTLSELSRRYGVPVATLRQINGLDGDRLIAGQTLRIPSDAMPAAPEGTDADSAYQATLARLNRLQQQLLPTDRIVHTVRPGESLWVISRRYGVSVAAVQRMNQLGRSTMIRPGQRLVIETGTRPSPPLAEERYVVQRGDSLWEISRRKRVDLEALMRWNDLGPDSVLKPGQTLIIRRAGDA
ncbi:MAG: LysM peptidoglycan-binding domain-containing protein [Wenzhouxiangellaceae bacterium]